MKKLIDVRVYLQRGRFVEQPVKFFLYIYIPSSLLSLDSHTYGKLNSHAYGKILIQVNGNQPLTPNY